MIQPAHLRMARAGLGWTLKDLADRAKVNLNTVSRYEAGREVLTGTIEKIENVFTKAGVEFIYEESLAGLGIRLPPGMGTKRKSYVSKKRSQKIL